MNLLPSDYYLKHHILAMLLRKSKSHCWKREYADFEPTVISMLLFFLVPRSGIESDCKHWVSTKPHLQEVFKAAGVSLCIV